MPLLADLIRLFSRRLINCEPNELVLVENCTFAFNSILNSICLKPNDKIVIYSTTYGVYTKILREKCISSKATLVEIKIELPILNENDLNQKYIDSLSNILEEDSEDKLIKYVFVDHIPSNIPFVLPIRKLSEFCKAKRNDIVFIVDGAHTLGSVSNFSLKELPNVDLMFMNCHKWLCGPKGTAFLFKNQKSSFKVSPAVQSHGFGNSFISEFIWTGLKQYSSYLGKSIEDSGYKYIKHIFIFLILQQKGLYAVFAIWEDCLGGFDNAIGYCNSLVREAGDLLVSSWSTSFLVDPSLCSTFLCVKLPVKFVVNTLNDRDLRSFKYEHAEVVQNYFHFEQKIEVPVKCVGGELYVRISCHLYNNLDEFKYLSKVVLDRMD